MLTLTAQIPPASTAFRQGQLGLGQQRTDVDWPYNGSWIPDRVSTREELLRYGHVPTTSSQRKQHCRVDWVMKFRIDFNYNCGFAGVFAREIPHGFQFELLLNRYIIWNLPVFTLHNAGRVTSRVDMKGLRRQSVMRERRVTRRF